MDTEILEQLKSIAAQLEKITKILEEKKTFAPKGPSFGDRKPFGGRDSFGKRDDKRFEGRRESRFGGGNSKPRFVADGRDFGFKNKKRRPF